MADTTVTAKFEADTRDIITKMRDLTNAFQDTQREVKKTSDIYQDAAGKWRNSSGQFASSSQKAAAGVGGMGTTVGKTSKSFGGLGKGALVAGAALAGGFGIAAAAAMSFGREAQESVSITRSTEAIIKATGGTALVTADQVGKLAQSISAKTGIDDEQIQAAQNMILTFKNVKNAGEGQAAMFDRASMCAADLSAAGFGSVESAAKMLGKALNDPTKGISALSRAGVTFTDQQKDQVKQMVAVGDTLGAQQLIMSEVESQVGGVAEAAASPFDKLQTIIGNFKENVGMAILPALESIVKAVGPILDQLAGPLGAIAGELGKLLTAVFTQIQPLITPLITAITQIVSVLAGGFLQAIQALLPAIVPLVTIIADLASRIAPILAPILAKVGEVLGKVLDAVMPLIGPLADLVLNIFQQASPLIDLVASVLLTLVDALTPVFAAVSQLIPPLNQLVTVLFAAIMPILQPLLPIIQTLADILGMILVKAIALLMTGLGYLIQGWAKLAPFILNNVTKPVVEFFLNMVDSVLHAARDLIGWIPGLGDKLNEAVDKFDGLKQGVSDGITAAANTVATEGAKIGQGLVDQGLGMFMSPDAPQAAGSTFGGNIVAGIASQTSAATNAGVMLTQAAIDGIGNKKLADAIGLVAKTPLSTTSIVDPSAAAYNVSGTGATTSGGGGGDNNAPTAAERTIMGMTLWKAAIKRYGPNVVKALRDNNKDIREAAAGYASSMDALKDARKQVNEARTLEDRAKAEIALAAAIRDRDVAQRHLADTIANSGKVEQATLRQQMDAANKALQGMKDNAKAALDYRRTIIQSLSSYASVTSISGDDKTSLTGQGIVANIQAKLAGIRNFRKVLTDLVGMGVDRTTLNSIIAMGPAGGTEFASALIAAGAGAIDDLKTAQINVADVSGGVADIGSMANFKLNGAQAQGISSTNVTIDKGAIVINFGSDVSRADATKINGIVQTALTRALSKVGKEGTR